MTATICTACRTHPAHDATVCQRCVDVLHGHLHAIPDLVRDLNLEIAKQVRRSLGPATVTVGHERPLPYNPAAASALDTLRFALVAACLSVAGGQRDRLPVDTIGAMCGWLLRYEQSVPLREDGGDIVTGIDGAVKRARRIVDNPPERRYIGNCTCTDDTGERRRMYARMGEPVYECRDCGSEWGVAESLERLEAELSDYGLTHKELETLMPKLPRTTLASWITRKQLVPQGTTAAGEPAYRYGDVLALNARREARRKSA